MTRPNALTPIGLQLMWDRLIAVVEEQAQSLIRTGFSTSTREAGDLSAGLFDASGADARPGGDRHARPREFDGALGRAFPRPLSRAAEMKPGDVFLTNDPWKGTGHLHDFTFVTPAFRDGRIVALFASTSHVVDIGGRGLTSDGRNVFEEGIYIPIMRFAERRKRSTARWSTSWRRTCASRCRWWATSTRSPPATTWAAAACSR